MTVWLILLALAAVSAVFTILLLAALTRHAQLRYDDVEEEAAAWRVYSRTAASRSATLSASKPLTRVP